MNPQLKKFIIQFCYILIDIIAISLGVFFAALLRSHKLNFDVTVENLFFNSSNSMSIIFVLWIFAGLISAKFFKLYKTEREIRKGAEAESVFQTVIATAVLVVLFIFSFKIENFPRSIIVLGSAFIFILMMFWRFLKRSFVEYLVSKGYNNFNVLIFGAGRVGQLLAVEIQKQRQLGFQIVGFLDDFKTENSESNIPVLGEIKDFSHVAEQHFIQKVFITVHHDDKVFSKILEEANDLNIAVRVIPHGFDFFSGDFRQYHIGLIPVWVYSDIFVPFHKLVSKRVFDFLVSAAALLLLMPVFLVISILIKLDSPGPVFYLCERYGRNGRKFKMFKFRTMVPGAHSKLKDLQTQNEVDGPIFKMKEDPRITKAGKFLRRFSLDELPQLINVLIGEMSLVGPRPFPIDQITREDIKQLKRLKVHPGITGLWQIRGRSDVSFSRLIRWDLWYINHWSFWLDLNILWQTIPVVIKRKGAY